MPDSHPPPLPACSPAVPAPAACTPLVLPGVERIFLVGMPGSGKSVVGSQLAKLLQWSFFDTDTEIETLCGASVSWIFEKEGEAGFRQRERNMLIKLATEKNAVIATGGGIVLNQENRILMRQQGGVIYLDVPLEALLERVKKNKRRPLLAHNPEEALKNLYNARWALYEEVMHHRVTSDNQRSPKTAAEAAFTRLLKSSSL